LGEHEVVRRARFRFCAATSLSGVVAVRRWKIESVRLHWTSFAEEVDLRKGERNQFFLSPIFVSCRLGNRKKHLPGARFTSCGEVVQKIARD